MSQTVKKSTRTAFSTFRLPFHYQGNIDATVKKINVNYGDGDIYTSKNATKHSSVYASLFCEYAYKRVRLHVIYKVWEDDFQKKKDSDGLQMEFDVYQDISSFIREGSRVETENGGKIKREYTPQNVVLKGSYPSASTTWWHKGEKTGYISLVDNDLPAWFVTDELQVKIDGKGSELDGEGNLAIKGCAVFTVERTDLVVETITQDDPVTVKPNQAPRMGDETKLTSISSVVMGALGRGYDICGVYADATSCRNKVIDVDKLNEYRRIRKTEKNYSQSRRAFGEGVQELSKSRAESLSVKVSGYGFGATFSNETKTTFNKETFDKTGYKYGTQYDIFVKDEYVVQSYNDSSIMTGFLTARFLEDLNTKSARDIIETYGTHVVLGMQVGTRFSYNMAYRQSTHKISTAKTFSNSTSVTYDSESGSAKDKNEDGKSKVSQTDKIYEDLMSDKISPEKLNAYANYLDKSSKGASGGGPVNEQQGKDGYGGAASVEYSKSTMETLLNEDQSTEVYCYTRGGDAQLGSLITQSFDLSVYKDWVKSCNDSNYVFADFVPNTLVPIYSLIPAGFRVNAQQVKEASDNYQKEHSIGSASSYKRGTELIYFETLGDANTDVVNSDEEIDTKAGKAIYWKLRIDLLNFDNGHCGYSISLKVCEGGRNANKSILLNHISDEIILKYGCKSMSIDTSNPTLGGKSYFEAEGNWTGSYHKWTDASKEIKDSDASRVIDTANPIEVHLDENGKDKGHVGVRGWIRIPWIGY